MNRHERRRVAKHFTNQAVEVGLFRQEQLLAGVHARCADPEFVHLVRATGKYLMEVFEGSREASCLACETQFSEAVQPLDFCVVIPWMVDWENFDHVGILVTGICDTCSKKSEEALRDAALKTLPFKYSFPPPSEGGH